MTDSTSILLPTQEALLERLLYVASYSQQLRVLTGNKGAGKSTLVTALVSELEDYNSALVICPMHASAAEIRRKILIQLLSDPLFDDELPLTETLLRLAADFSRPIHIVIDDAQLMPLELWAECLLLSDIHCGGRPISVTLTSEPELLTSLLASLIPQQRELILQIDIAPLPMTEREALYYTLMSRSERLPYVPREIVRSQLERQSGSPAEVVTLLKKALEPEAEESKVRKSLWYLLGAVLLVLAVAVAWFWPVTEPGQQGYLALSGQSALWGESELQDYFAWRQQLSATPKKNTGAETLKGSAGQSNKVNADKVASSNIDNAEKPQPTEATAVIHDQIEASNSSDIEPQDEADSALLQDARAVADINVQNVTESASHKAVETSAMEQNAGAKVLTAKVSTAKGESGSSSLPAAKTQVKVDTQDSTLKASTLPVEGYTLQLATVNKRDSLTEVLQLLPQDAKPILARSGAKMVILLGQFSTLKQAKLEAEALTRHNAKLTPWIRNWSQLQQYEPLAVDAP